MFPRGVPEGIVNQGDAKVFGWKGASVETKISEIWRWIGGGVLKKKIWDFLLVAVQT
jgi:hypothetical protein